MIKKLLIFFSGMAGSLLVGVLFLRSPIRSELVSPMVNEPEIVLGSTALSTTDTRVVSLDSVFDGHSYQRQNGDVVMMATGDVIPARVTDDRIRKFNSDFPFEKIRPTLQSSDFVVANLEAPLIASCRPHLEGMVFCGVPAFAAAMQRANIAVATLENNHISNHGSGGKEETIAQLSSAGIDVAVAGQPLIRTEKSIRFGFVAINGVGPSVQKERVSHEIALLREQVDVIVVSIHWGKEYVYDPQKAAGIAPDNPQDIAHFLIDAGADLIIGNHPHWVQGVELYKNGFITYAHGNFIFDQEWSRETKEGVIGSYVFSDKKLVDVFFTPIVIENYAQPRLAIETEIQKILQVMHKSSLRLL